MGDTPLIRRVSAKAVRFLFNDLRFWERAQSGELRVEVRRNKHPSPPLANEPLCTRSQMLAYFDADGRRVAIVHQYLRRTGEVGLSGRPDPKWLLVDDIVYKVVGEPAEHQIS